MNSKLHCSQTAIITVGGIGMMSELRNLLCSTAKPKLVHKLITVTVLGELKAVLNTLNPVSFSLIIFTFLCLKSAFWEVCILCLICVYAVVGKP